MGKLTEVAKLGYGVFSAGKSVVGLVKSPAKFARNFAIKTGKSALLAGLKAAFGEQWAHGAISKLHVAGKSIEGSFGLRVPQTIAKRAMDPEGAALLEKIANDVLEIPFELIGYKLAQTIVSYDEQTRELRLGLKLGVLEMGQNSLPAASKSIVDQHQAPSLPAEPRVQEAKPKRKRSTPKA